MIRRPPRSTRTDTLFPYTTLFRSVSVAIDVTLHAMPVFYCALPGTTADNASWVRRKRAVTLRFFRSSYAVGRVLAQQNMTIEARSEEHTSELQSLMRISYAVFCLKKKKKEKQNTKQPGT